MTGVRFSIATTSTVSPGIGRARHQASISATALAMWPFSRHFGSNIGDLFGILTYSTRAGTIDSRQTVSTWSEAWRSSRLLAETVGVMAARGVEEAEDRKAPG